MVKEFPSYALKTKIELTFHWNSIQFNLEQLETEGWYHDMKKSKYLSAIPASLGF